MIWFLATLLLLAAVVIWFNIYYLYYANRLTQIIGFVLSVGGYVALMTWWMGVLR